jgi:hypothetical protein
MGPNRILRFINLMKDGQPNIVRYYTEGECYRFACILRELFPGGTIWYAQVPGHMYYYYQGAWYDIRGRHLRRPHTAKPYRRGGHLPHRWSSNSNNPY